jgi:hypothetical protein
MHPRSQGTRVEAQDLCRPVFSIDAPPDFRMKKTFLNDDQVRSGQSFSENLEFRS